MKTKREVVDVLQECIETEKNSHREIVKGKWKLVNKEAKHRIDCLKAAIKAVDP